MFLPMQSLKLREVVVMAQRVLHTRAIIPSIDSMGFSGTRSRKRRRGKCVGGLRRVNCNCPANSPFSFSTMPAPLRRVIILNLPRTDSRQGKFILISASSCTSIWLFALHGANLCLHDGWNYVCSSPQSCKSVPQHRSFDRNNIRSVERKNGIEIPPLII